MFAVNAWTFFFCFCSLHWLFLGIIKYLYCDLHLDGKSWPFFVPWNYLLTKFKAKKLYSDTIIFLLNSYAPLLVERAEPQSGLS